MKRVLAFLLLIVIAFSLSACDSKQPANQANTRMIVDSAGDSVQIPANVDTVINLVTYGCQVMVGLGFGDYLTGINVDAIESAWMVEMYPRISEVEKFDQEASAEILLRTNADVVFVESADQARDL